MIQNEFKLLEEAHYRSVVKAIRYIWGNEANMVKIVEDNGRLFAECEFTMSRRCLTEDNHEEVLNDMFYDYCVENADWMGVS